jgi:hypothetical protein
MTKIFQILCIIFFASKTQAQNHFGSDEERKSLDKATAASRDVFANGDAAPLQQALIVKYFAGNNVVTGRAAFEKGLEEWLSTSTILFAQNKVESTVFAGEMAAQVAIFSIKSTPETGGNPVISQGPWLFM